MKNEATHAKKLAALLKRVRQSHPGEPFSSRDPVTQLVVSFLQWEASRRAAEDAYERLMRGMADHNDLRVSHPQEVAELLGPRYPRAEERAARLHEALQEVYRREHAVSLEPLASKPKKAVRTYLDTLPGMTPYVAAEVTLVSFGGHAVPVDDRLAGLLRDESAADEGSTLDEVASYLERQIKAEEALEVHASLQAWADASTPRAAKESGVAKPEPKLTKRPTKKPAGK